MPTESRTVVFNSGEVMEAMRDYCTKTNRPLRGGLKWVASAEDGNLSISLEPYGGGAAVSLNHSEIAVALIMFCNKKGIGIPRKATKSLQATAESISLQMEL